jgi:hypothetical protein
VADCRRTGLVRLASPDQRGLPRRRPESGYGSFSLITSKQRITMPFVLATLLAVVLPISPGLAQMFRDRIAGLLTDELKAVVAGANVTFTNVGFACLAMLGTTHKEKL